MTPKPTNLIFPLRSACIHLVAMLGASAHAQFSYHHAYAPGTTSDFHSDKYGWSVATTEDWIVVGSPFANASAGEVRVYPAEDFLNGTSAVPIALTDTIGPASNQKFGASVDAHGSTIVVGNCSAQGGSEYCGADAAWVSVFNLVDGSWAESQRIPRPAGATGRFGLALAVHDNRLAIGGARVGTTQDHREAVYLYHRDDSGADFLPTDTLQGEPGSGDASDDFGYAMDMTAEHLVIGARADDELGPDAGAAYVYTNDGTPPFYGYLVRKLLASDGGAEDLFGLSVALLEDVCAVGAPQKHFNGEPVGAAYVFQQNEGFTDNWGQVSTLFPDTAHQQPTMQFGSSVALSADRIAVGAPQDSLGTAHLQGSVTIFGGEASNWERVQTIEPKTDEHVNEVSRSGTSLAFANGALLIGAPWAIVNSGSAFPTGGVLVYADPLLGIDQFASLNARLWPVPATDYLMVDVGAGHPTPMRTIVHDAIGRVVLDQSFTFGNAPVRLDLSSLPAGLCSISILPQESTRPFRALFIRQ